MGGTPVFRGTRVPLHLIADLLKGGESMDALREDYPSLSEEQIRLAPLCTRAYPRRDRPRSVRFWPGLRLVRVTVVPLRPVA